VVHYNPRYERESARWNPKPVPPEFRIEMALYAGPLFALSFFWFARVILLSVKYESADTIFSSWTSFPHLSYWGPMLSGLLMGFSIQLIFVRKSRQWLDYPGTDTCTVGSFQLYYRCLFVCRRVSSGIQHSNPKHVWSCLSCS